MSKRKRETYEQFLQNKLRDSPLFRQGLHDPFAEPAVVNGTSAGLSSLGCEAYAPRRVEPELSDSDLTARVGHSAVFSQHVSIGSILETLPGLLTSVQTGSQCSDQRNEW